jgi:hypothetical protein
MRRIFVLILVIFTLLQWSNFADATSLNEAYKNQQSNIQVKGSGKVIRILNDDNKGSRHQKFILKLNSGNTILIAHNIDQKSILFQMVTQFSFMVNMNGIKKVVLCIGLIEIQIGIILVVG